MKVFGYRFLKNTLFVFFKFILIGLFILSVFELGSHYFGSISNNYKLYSEMRSLENYGNTAMAEYVDKAEDGLLKYGFIVDDTKYIVLIEENSVVSIDKPVEIVYDIFNPSFNMRVSEIEENDLNNFFSDMLKTVCYFYLITMFFVFILGICWYLLDYIKYNKTLWKAYV